MLLKLATYLTTSSVMVQQTCMAHYVNVTPAPSTLSTLASIVARPSTTIFDRHPIDNPLSPHLRDSLPPSWLHGSLAFFTIDWSQTSIEPHTGGRTALSTANLTCLGLHRSRDQIWLRPRASRTRCKYASMNKDLIVFMEFLFESFEAVPRYSVDLWRIPASFPGCLYTNGTAWLSSVHCCAEMNPCRVESLLLKPRIAESYQYNFCPLSLWRVHCIHDYVLMREL